jgi:hypothetical protein
LFTVFASVVAKRSGGQAVFRSLSSHPFSAPSFSAVDVGSASEESPGRGTEALNENKHAIIPLQEYAHTLLLLMYINTDVKLKRTKIVDRFHVQYFFVIKFKHMITGGLLHGNYKPRRQSLKIFLYWSDDALYMLALAATLPSKRHIQT